MITTVIPNFKRPNFLKRAILSAYKAGAPHIVVVSCGVTREVEEVHKWATATVKNISVISRADDPGLNV